jgi:hypothetical protein
MRTRRSPRNQEILWRALGDVVKLKKPTRARLMSRVEARRRMFSPKVTEQIRVAVEERRKRDESE